MAVPGEVAGPPVGRGVRLGMERPTPSNESVSIVLATRNGEEHLQEQLSSLASQELLPAELVVGDDASTDSTVEILTAFARESPFPVRLVTRTEALGYADNFMRTGQIARGSLLAFCDQDDIWRPAKLRLVVDAFAQSPHIVLVAHQFDLIDSVGFRLPVRRSYTFKPGGRWPFGFALTARRTVLDCLHYVAWPFGSDNPDGTAHDTWLWYIGNLVGQSVILPERLVAYRLHSRNLYGQLNLRCVTSVQRSLLRVSQIRAKNALPRWDSSLTSLRREADYVDQLRRAWAGDGHDEWAYRGGVYLETLCGEIERLAQRKSLLQIGRRSSALRSLASMVRAGMYERPQAAIADGLRIALGRRGTQGVRGNSERSGIVP